MNIKYLRISLKIWISLRISLNIQEILEDIFNHLVISRTFSSVADILEDIPKYLEISLNIKEMIKDIIGYH